MTTYDDSIKIISVHDEAYKYISEYCKNHRDVSFLDIGGKDGQGKVTKGTRQNFEIKYNNLEIDEEIDIPELIKGDICNCPQIADESYDIVFSHNVFEHLRAPWLAAEECVRINKQGGLNVHIAPFSWRYHPVPIDYFRFTHAGLKSLFEYSGKMEELVSGYDLKRRKKNKGYSLKTVSVGELEGWSESWLILYVGKKVK